MKKLPKYLEVVEYFQKRIENNEMLLGEFLPSENELCRQFSASHMTLSKAMGELAAKGYVKRTPGVGTTVSYAYRTPVQKTLETLSAPESMTDLIRNAGMVPGTKLINYTVLRGSDVPDVATQLEVGPDEFLHFFVRARYGDDSLVCLSYTYLAQSVVHTIDITRLLGSLDEYLQELGISRSYGRRSHCATLPTEEQAKLIGTSHIALLKETILWRTEDRPFELTYHYFIGERYTISQDRISQERVMQVNRNEHHIL